MVTPLLSGCPASKGSSAPPPSNFSAIAGDGRVTVTWTPTPGVDYWIFSATDPGLTGLNWSGLAHANAQVNAATPLYMCGLLDDLPYYFASNGRTNGGPGGTSSPTINATPYNASTHWTLNPTPIAEIVNNAVVNPDISGLAYASLTTCGNNAAISATGMFAAVGSGGAIFTSNDGISWGPALSPTSSNLNAVTGYAANQNNALNPALRWMAVGDAGTVVYFDGSVWVLANTYYANSTLAAANPGNSTLRSITQVGGTFYAVGDAGTIISSPDAINWTIHNSPPVTSNNLNGVTYGGGIFVAVGEQRHTIDQRRWQHLGGPNAVTCDSVRCQPAESGCLRQHLRLYLCSGGRWRHDRDQRQLPWNQPMDGANPAGLAQSGRDNSGSAGGGNEWKLGHHSSTRSQAGIHFIGSVRGHRQQRQCLHQHQWLRLVRRDTHRSNRPECADQQRFRICRHGKQRRVCNCLLTLTGNCSLQRVELSFRYRT